MEKCALENGEVIDHPKGSLRWNAQRLLMSGDVPSIKELADRLDGKVPQAVVGDDNEDPVRVAVSRIELVAPSDGNSEG